MVIEYGVKFAASLHYTRFAGPLQRVLCLFAPQMLTFIVRIIFLLEINNEPPLKGIF